MRPDQRWFPTNMTERAAAFNIFAKNFANIGLDLGFTQDEIDAVDADNAVVQFVARTIAATKAYTTAVVAFQHGVLLGDIDGTTHEFPTPPVITPPAITPTGIFERLELLVRRIRVMPRYTEASGALLGIIPRQARLIDHHEHEPKFKVAASSEPYTFDIKVTRLHFDGFDVDIRRADATEWEHGGIFARSPAQISIVPTVPGQAELLEVRVRMRLGNDAVGNYSGVKTVAVTP